jgi:transposase
MSINGMVRPCSCPASDRSWQGAPRQGAHHASDSTTAVAVIGIDIGKNSFHIAGLDSRGAIVLRQKWSRGQVEVRLANMSPCLIGIEACVGAHHLSRKLKALSHDARLMPAKYVPSSIKIRAFLLERGVAVRQGLRASRRGNSARKNRRYAD